MACPNFVFGVLNGTSGYEYPNIPRQVVPGSEWITSLFGNYFVEHRMPWDGKAFNGRSDYVNNSAHTIHIPHTTHSSARFLTAIASPRALL